MQIDDDRAVELDVRLEPASEVAFRLVAPEGAVCNDELRFDLFDAAGAAVFTSPAVGSERDGRTVFYVGPIGLPTGTYELRARTVRDPRAPTVFEAALEVTVEQSPEPVWRTVKLVRSAERR